MTNMHSTSSWNVGRASGQCASCGVELSPGTTCWAALCDRPVEVEGGGLSPAEKAVEAKKGAEKSKKEGDGKAEPSPFLRIDFCEKCWGEGKRPGDAGGEGAPLTMFSFWKTQVPVPEQKKKLLVDDSVLVDVFQRMEGKSEPQEIRFRFVLALILMRKRLLRYEGMEPAAEGAAGGSEGGAKAPDTWRMIPRGSDKVVHVIDPHLTEEQIAEVSQQLSAILAEEV